MAGSEERLKILSLVQEGKISPEEGIKLLKALDRAMGPLPAEPPPPPQAPPASPAYQPGPRWLRLRITDTRSNKVRVNVRLPVTVLNAGVKMGARFSPEIGQAEMGRIMDAIHSGATGQVIDIFDDEDGEHIEVLLE
jgi:hypothetical protein